MENFTLVGLSEIADMAEPKVTKQAVANWRRRFDDFPRPHQTLSSGPVWNKEVIEGWLLKKGGLAPKVISFINLKGGVGKTTTSIGVAEVLAYHHKMNVLFIDLDPQTNATINLIGEERWQECNNKGQTLAQLFRDKIQFDREPIFDIEKAILRGVSMVDGGIPRLDLLPSSIEFIELQERLPFVGVQGEFQVNPQIILRDALKPVIERYDWVVIDCPPSLGIVTKNGLRMTTHYCIPTIPDIVSTWGIYQIVRSIDTFADSVSSKIEAAGIVATKVQVNRLHSRIIEDMSQGRLFAGKNTGHVQPRLLANQIRQRAVTAAGANADAGRMSLSSKYGPENYEELKGLTKELMQVCHN
ncbi:MAG: ParA family protein [Fimbriimonas sp.]